MTIDIINKTITIDEPISVEDLIIKLELELKQYRDYTILSNRVGWYTSATSGNTTLATSAATLPTGVGTTTGLHITPSTTSITTGNITVPNNKTYHTKYTL